MALWVKDYPRVSGFRQLSGEGSGLNLRAMPEKQEQINGLEAPGLRTGLIFNPEAPIKLLTFLSIPWGSFYLGSESFRGITASWV